ncbi:MAG: PKD domain-containing protein, partial [Thermoplasmata archaeon]|nr:PKD domain-containing protein [Thermoplasmata archaeon]
MTLSLTNVTDETILVAKFTVEEIPPTSEFDKYGRIDDYVTFFVFTVAENTPVSFYTGGSMTLELFRIDRGDFISVPERCSIKGVTPGQLWDGNGLLLSLPDSNTPLSIEASSPDVLEYYGVTDNAVSRFGIIDEEGVETSLPAGSEKLIVKGDTYSDFTLRLRPTSTGSPTHFNSNLIAAAGLDRTVDPGETVVFDGSESISWNGEVVNYTWDLGDGTMAYEEVFSHVYPDDGVYMVNLSTEDSFGYTDEDSMVVYVNNLPPAVDAGDDLIVEEDETFVLNGSAADTPLDLQSLNYTWKLGDGTIFHETGVEHSYSCAGVYESVFQVLDEDGAMGLDTVMITVLNLPPVAVADGGLFSQAGDANVCFFSAANSTDTPSDMETLMYHWDFGDGTTLYGREVRHVYYGAGDYNVILTVTDDQEASSTDILPISISSIPPVADAGENRVTYTNTLLVFDGTGSYDPDGEIVSYHWDFADGHTSSGAQPVHSYADDGEYIVVLTVTDDDGVTDTDTCKVTVLNQPPVASAETYQNVNITLRVAGKKWNNVTLILYEEERIVGEVKIQRQPGDPDKQSKSIDTCLDIQNYNHMIIGYNALGLGDNPVWVNMSFEDGLWKEFKINFNVATLEETQYRTRDLNGVFSGKPITFDASGSYDSDTNPNDAIPYLRYLWDFGDGNTSAQQIATHTYDQNGVYTVSLTVMDDDDATDTRTFSLTITRRQPQAAITLKSTTSQVYQTGVSEFQGDPDKKIMFDGSESYDPDNDTLTYLWDYGDGDTGSKQVDKHSYQDPGTYILSLTVTGPLGNSHTAYATIMIISDVYPPIAVAGTDRLAYKDKPIAFDAAGSYDPDGNIVGYVWDFGDNTTATGYNVSHSYPLEGVYVVLLTVVDDDGLTGQDSITVTVINGIPIAIAGPDQAVYEDDTVHFDGSGSYDPDGGTMEFRWDFDSSNGIQIDAVGPNPSHVYTLARTYLVTLTVVDDEGDSVTDTLEVRVSNVPPTAYGGADRVLLEDQSTIFTGTGTDTA